MTRSTILPRPEVGGDADEADMATLIRPLPSFALNAFDVHHFGSNDQTSAGDSLRPVSLDQIIDAIELDGLAVPTAAEIKAHMLRVRAQRLAAGGVVTSADGRWTRAIVALALCAGFAMAATTAPVQGLLHTGASFVGPRAAAASQAVRPESLPTTASVDAALTTRVVAPIVLVVPGAASTESAAKAAVPAAKISKPARTKAKGRK